jgi:predicted DNA-binding transcriptional regulator YafY
MRADRLLSILLLLQVHRRMTARQLAERLEVSERTIHRDMEALAMGGVPVYAERGARGGWMLSDGFRTKLPGLTEPEIRALFLSRPEHLLADLGLARASDAGFIKLLAALPAQHRLDAERARERIHVDGAGWAGAKEQVPFLPALQEAVWDERRVMLTYQPAGAAAAERSVDPLGLVAKVWRYGLSEGARSLPESAACSRRCHAPPRHRARALPTRTASIPFGGSW